MLVVGGSRETSGAFSHLPTSVRMKHRDGRRSPPMGSSTSVHKTIAHVPMADPSMSRMAGPCLQCHATAGRCSDLTSAWRHGCPNNVTSNETVRQTRVLQGGRLRPSFSSCSVQPSDQDGFRWGWLVVGSRAADGRPMCS
jgi:hypothetical protein